MASSTESKTFSFTSTTAAFQLKGGRYLFNIAASANFNGATVTFTALAPDNATYVLVRSQANTNASFTTSQVLVLDLPPGTYRLAVTVAVPTAPLVASITSIPL